MMQSSVILRGIVDIQSEEITRLMSLVEHLTGCLEQSQSREKAALQRCSELETTVSNQASAASRRACEAFAPVFDPSASDMDALDSPDAKARSETLAPIVFVISY
jgi:hypothetical protein